MDLKHTDGFNIPAFAIKPQTIKNRLTKNLNQVKTIKRYFRNQKIF